MNLLPRIDAIVSKNDKRQQVKVQHDSYSMLIQRIYGVAMGFEYLNDHKDLRHDIAWQTTADKVEPLVSTSTLYRFENNSIRETCKELMNLMIDIFIESLESSPSEITLDFDNTNNTIHGKQEGGFFHGYYNEYCFLPLYVFFRGKISNCFFTTIG